MQSTDTSGDTSAEPPPMAPAAMITLCPLWARPAASALSMPAFTAADTSCSVSTLQG
jgi:hypothetical protein